MLESNPHHNKGNVIMSGNMLCSKSINAKINNPQVKINAAKVCKLIPNRSMTINEATKVKISISG